jgi:hypothetical protein
VSCRVLSCLALSWFGLVCLVGSYLCLVFVFVIMFVSNDAPVGDLPLPYPSHLQLKKFVPFGVIKVMSCMVRREWVQQERGLGVGLGLRVRVRID